MMKLSVGDLVFMSFGIASVLVMLLMGFGQPKEMDPEAELRSKKSFLRQIERPRSAALTIALILAMSAVAYVVMAIIGKAT